MFEFLKKPIQTLSDAQLDEVARHDDARRAALAERARREEAKRIAAETAEAERREREREAEVARLEQEAAALRRDFAAADAALLDSIGEASRRLNEANALAVRHGEVGARLAALHGKHLQVLRPFVPETSGGPAALGDLVAVVTRKLGGVPEGRALFPVRAALLELANERPL